MYLWIFAKLDYSFFDDYEASAKDDDDEDEYDQKLRQFKSSVQWAGERYCRKQKAEREGYNVDDEYFYGIKYLAELVSNYLATGLEAVPPKGRAESVTRSGDPSEGGGYLASLVDLQRGLLHLPKHHRERLTVRFGALCELSDESVASLSQSEIVRLTGMHPDQYRDLLGQTRDQVRHRVNGSLRKLQGTLGGSSPWKGDYRSTR